VEGEEAITGVLRLQGEDAEEEELRQSKEEKSYELSMKNMG